MNKQYLHRKAGWSGASTQKIGGVVLALIGGIQAAIGGSGFQAGIGICVFFLGVYNSGRAVITLHEDHMEMKKAPLTGLHLIRYRDMVGLEEVSKKKVVLKTTDKPITLPLAVLEDEDQQDLVTTLKQVMARAKESAQISA